MSLLLVLLLASGSLQLHVLNLSMRYYDQMEAVPIYQTCLMIMWILSGLIMLNERQFYTGL